MSIRWLQSSGTVVSVLLLAACSAAGPPQPAQPAAAPVQALPERPNVLVIEADDMRSDDLRWMPNVRRLIRAKGLVFRNSFAPNPLCCPSRASFLNGRHSHNHRVLSHEDPFGFQSFDDSSTLATKLRRSGYRTALVGKYLNWYGEQPTHDGRSSLRYVPPGWSQWWGASDHLWKPGDRFQGGTYNYFRLTSNVNGEIRTWPGRYNTEVTAAQTRQLLARFAKDPTRPFFIWWTPVAPHHGNPVEPDDPADTVTPGGYRVRWLSPARPDWVKGRFDARIPRGSGVPASHPAERDVSDKPAYVRGFPPLTRAEKRAERTITRQRAEALFVLDVHIGRLMADLAASPVRKRTVVVFTSDNGVYLGEHRKRQGKINLHEPSIRVPLLMTGPGIPTGTRFDPVTTIDLSATIAALAGVHLDSPDGNDIRPTITGGDQGWIRPVLLEGRMPEPAYQKAGDADPVMRGLDTVGVRLGRWKYVRYSTGETELYDLQNDPLELRSLSGASPIRDRMERIWNRYVRCAEDSCRRPLPVDLQLTPEQVRDLTVAQTEAEQRYYER